MAALAVGSGCDDAGNSRAAASAQDDDAAAGDATPSTPGQADAGAASDPDVDAAADDRPVGGGPASQGRPGPSPGGHDVGGGVAIDGSSPDAPEPVPAATPPIEIRVAKRAMMIYAAASEASPYRGKLPRGEAFAVYEHMPVADPPDAACGRPGWARVGPSAYVCLRHTEPTETVPAVLPRLGPGRRMPHVYAKLRNADAEVPMYRSRRAMLDGAEPIDQLEPDHDYAFVRRKRTSGGGLYYDARKRVVPGAGLRRLEPSTFGGREIDLEAEPIPEGEWMAWAVQWPYAPVLAAPRDDAEEVARLEYQAEIRLTDEPTTRGRITWWPLADGSGYVSSKHSRRWIPMDASEEAPTDEVWLDVELTQQTLTLWRGHSPSFVTLVSTGTWKDPTPRGLYRLEAKLAVSAMRSKPSADDAYHVEAVPWVMYFDGRYGLHGTYWHNRFGRRTSHGCINLSPLDARRVFESTAPHVAPGWVAAYEHAVEPGTLLRIRKGVEAPPDRRDPLEATAAEAESP